MAFNLRPGEKIRVLGSGQPSGPLTFLIPRPRGVRSITVVVHDQNGGPLGNGRPFRKTFHFRKGLPGGTFAFTRAEDDTSVFGQTFVLYHGRRTSGGTWGHDTVSATLTGQCNAVKLPVVPFTNGDPLPDGVSHNLVAVKLHGQTVLRNRKHIL